MQKDISEKQLIKHNDVFADIYNALIFGGQEILKEETLFPVPVESVTRRIDKRLKEGRGDIRKTDRLNGQYCLIVGIENQTEYDNTMPERAMGYDFGAYEEQIREIQVWNKMQKKPAYHKRIHDHQKLAPSITAVLYLGKGEWKGPKDLHDMLRFPEEIGETIRPYVANYPLHVISVSNLSDEERRRLKSDFFLVAEYLAGRNKKEAYERLRKEKTHAIRHPEELFDVLAAISEDDRYYYMAEVLEEAERDKDTAEYVDNDEENNKEGITMCELWDYVENTGIQKGIQQGIQQGIRQAQEELNKLILLLLKEKRYEDLERCAQDEEYKQNLMKKYGIL